MCCLQLTATTIHLALVHLKTKSLFYFHYPFILSFLPRHAVTMRRMVVYLFLCCGQRGAGFNFWCFEDFASSTTFHGSFAFGTLIVHL